jgi:hypothetical protein
MSWTRKLLRGAAGAAVAAGWTPSVRAAPEWTTDAGIYLAYHFGGGAPGQVAVGLELRRLHGDIPICAESVRLVGGLGRIELVGWDQLRLAVGPLVTRNTQFTEVAADLSLGVRLGRAPGWHAEPGLEGALLGLMRARIAYAITQDFSVGGGLRTPRTLAFGCAVTGRPLRRGDGVVLPAAIVAGEPTADGAPSRAAKVWADRACGEWASVPAFLELADQLRACGAPTPLVAAARAAAEDELRHAVVAAGVSASLGERTVSLEPPALDRRPPAAGREGLVRLAVESWLDGCLGEGAAAAGLAAEAKQARFADLRRAQRTIAADEGRHADLAWDVLAWALSVGGRDLRASLDRALAQAPVEGAEADADLAHFGCLPPDQRRRVALEVRKGAVDRLRTLAGGPSTVGER